MFRATIKIGVYAALAVLWAWAIFFASGDIPKAVGHATLLGTIVWVLGVFLKERMTSVNTMPDGSKDASDRDAT